MKARMYQNRYSHFTYSTHNGLTMDEVVAAVTDNCSVKPNIRAPLFAFPSHTYFITLYTGCPARSLQYRDRRTNGVKKKT